MTDFNSNESFPRSCFFFSFFFESTTMLLALSMKFYVVCVNVVPLVAVSIGISSVCMCEITIPLQCQLNQMSYQQATQVSHRSHRTGFVPCNLLHRQPRVSMCYIRYNLSKANAKWCVQCHRAIRPTSADAHCPMNASWLLRISFRKYVALASTEKSQEESSILKKVFLFFAQSN